MYGCITQMIQTIVNSSDHKRFFCELFHFGWCCCCCSGGCVAFVIGKFCWRCFYSTSSSKIEDNRGLSRVKYQILEIQDNCRSWKPSAVLENRKIQYEKWHKKKMVLRNSWRNDDNLQICGNAMEFSDGKSKEKTQKKSRCECVSMAWIAIQRTNTIAESKW